MGFLELSSAVVTSASNRIVSQVGDWYDPGDNANVTIARGFIEQIPTDIGIGIKLYFNNPKIIMQPSCYYWCARIV